MDEAQMALEELDYYHVIQPIIEINTNQVFGYEMLLRSKTIQNPELLFHYAKEQNQQMELDLHSIEKAFQTINHSEEWFRDARVFINALPSTIGNVTAVRQIQFWRDTLKLAPDKIVFEITEEKKEDSIICKHMIGDMKKHGFLIAVDDLGKGDSTLAYAIELTPHVVKLDRAFARDLANSPGRQKEIEALVHFFDKDTILILEGIETEADLQAAKEAGIRYVQGYYLGRPEPLHYYRN